VDFGPSPRRRARGGTFSLLTFTGPPNKSPTTGDEKWGHENFTDRVVRAV
jgi:hypothetical protein